MNKSNLTQAQQKPKFSTAVNTPSYQKLIYSTLGDPDRAKRFIATITSSVAVNPALQECDAGTILAAALLGESLNLSPSPQLGQFYLVPFKSKAKYDRQGNMIEPETVKAQFVLGYKGYIQLAIRSGQYKKLNVLEIKQGELNYFDPLNEEISCNLIEDYEKRFAAPTIGYYAMFEYINGFRKAIYWSKDKMLSHADRYSAAFSTEAYQKIENGEIADKDMWKYSSFWYKDFDDMAKKTMLRHLISRWGVMSTEMQQAFEKDSSINEPEIDQNAAGIPEENPLQAAEEQNIQKVDMDAL
ncbi:MAG TPA: recombinase RecT [Firmicutes bacterium]|nr:recombinase RecT [Bacillota bacterium]